MFIVYILKGPKNHLYIGCTSDLDKRLKRHKIGEGAEFTSRNKTFDIVFKERFATLKEARQREAQIKKWRREKKENLIKFRKPII